jgi:hypothetical protein
MSKFGSKDSGSSSGGSSDRADASKDGLSGSGGGGVGVRSSAGLFRLPCDLDFREISDLVHDFVFFDFDCFSVSSSASSSPSAAKVGLSTESGDVGGEGSKEGSEMLDRRTCVGFFESHQPKLLLFGDFTSEVVLDGGCSETGVDTADFGLSFSSIGAWSSCLSLVIESRMLPELCGRAFELSSSNVVCSGKRAIRVDGGLDVLRLITEDKLPDTEWPPRIVDSELSVSDEMVDRGRMYSTRSEKPTRTLGTTLGGESELLRVCSGLDRKSAVEVALLCWWPKKGFGSSSRGVAGALPPRLMWAKSFGCMIVCRS